MPRKKKITETKTKPLKEYKGIVKTPFKIEGIDYKTGAEYKTTILGRLQHLQKNNYIKI